MAESLGEHTFACQLAPRAEGAEHIAFWVGPAELRERRRSLVRLGAASEVPA
jgi:hypothetical protein